MSTIEHPSGRPLRRRELLRIGSIAGAALLLTACAGNSPAASTGAAPAATAAPGQAGASAAWDQLVSAAQKEGKVVVSGPPTPETRSKLPELFKQKFNIELEYLAGNSSQLASRIESERAAGQYSMDASVGGPDTVYGTFLSNKWLDPLKPALILPDVVDPKVWPTGGPWFRDPGGDTSLQIFNTISPIGYINTSSLKASDVQTTNDLVNTNLKGKIASYDPSVNGGGLIFGSVLYVTRGAEFATQFFQGQAVAYTRDYQQIADWVAHDSYSIGIGATPTYMTPYQGAAPIQQLILSDVKTIVSGGFSIVSLWNKAPHPNAAKVFANWIASKEGAAAYATTEGAAPVRTDLDASAWLDKDLIPKPNGDYFDVYDYKYVVEQRQPIAQFYAGLKGGG